MSDIFPIRAVPAAETLIRCQSQADDMLRWAEITHWDFVVDESVLKVGADFLEIYGYKLTDLHPITVEQWEKFIHPDDIHIASMFEKMLAGHIDIINTICQMKTATGQWRYFRIRGGIAETSQTDKKVIRISGTLQDVTDLIIADATLQRRDRLLAAVNNTASLLLTTAPESFDQSIVHILQILGETTNVDRVYVWKNEWLGKELCCSQSYEWSPHAKPQQGNEQTINIKYSESIPTWEKKLGAGECINSIVRNMPQAEQDQLAPQGIVSILVAPILLRNEFWGFIGFDDCQQERIWDRTESSILQSAGMLIASAIQRRTAENELIRKQRTLDWILETSPVAILISSGGTLISLNKRSRELFTLEKGSPVSILHERILGKHQNTINRDLIVNEIRSKGAFFREDIQFSCADGVVRDFMLTSLLVEPDNIQERITWIVDVTGLKETERALSQARHNAEIAANAKSEFLARMSHEIRTPMNAVLGMIYLCLQTDVNEKQRDYLTKTQSSAQNLLGIINDILDISKIESGKLELELIPFSLKKTIDDVIDTIRISAEEKGLKIITQIDSELHDSWIGDPLRLRQILLNLASNAIKFTDIGGIFITVKQDESWSHRDTEKICLAFEVKDTGIGLQPNQFDNIFESFSQADGSTTRKYGGTGLGLAIVKSLVELMEGKITVTSVPGQGATFHFTLVLKWSHVNPGMSSVSLLNTRRVLIVDDDANDLEILTNLVQSMGMNVLSVRSGAAVLEKLEEATYLRIPIELVLIDWRMPRMDGIETVRLIRGNKKITPPRIILVSAYDRQDCLRLVQGLNVAEVLVKPVNHVMLKEALKTAFREDLAQKTNEVCADIRGAKILLAEDNKINQLVVSELLKIFNIDLTVANNGKEAVEAVKQSDFDLILMDIQMPEMDGLTATQAIRHLDKPDMDKLPILAMTANAFDTDYQKSLAAGMDDHLTKPIDPEKLRIALEKWIVR